jgi:predicted acyltransferase
MAGAAQDRLISLDVFRGMTIAGMVLVNNPGTWSAIYGPLKHVDWHGITPTDYVFPFFLFIVGVAIPIALSKRVAAGVTRDVYYKILTRSLLIFALGIAMSAIPFFNFADTTIPYGIKILCVLGYSAALFFYLWDKAKIALIVAGVTAGIVTAFWLAGYVVVPYNVATMRIPGVLQRIAVCYLIVSLIYLHTSWRQQAVIGTVLLLGYWLMMTVIPVPGCEVTTIDDKACNLAAWLDRTVLTEAHIWRSAKVYDPEGILSTIPAVVTCLTGVLTGTWLTRKRANGEVPDKVETVSGLFFAGTVALAVGWSWSLVFPLNKALWTSSYVIYTTGLALLTLAACYWLIDIKQMKWWTKPFVIFGVNALALFVFSGIMARLLGMMRVPGVDGKEISLQQWIFQTFFLSWAEPINASLAYAVTFILFWLFLMWLLYRKNIYIKV